jgi:prepilin-type N-terminal cleavage/methylation domain-containing protein
MSKKHLGNQKGFTLIEIIAVLLLLGIMAAVAVPKYFDMQLETENQTLKTALNDMKSRAILAYSKSILKNDGVADPLEQATFADILLGTDAEVRASYKDFVAGDLAWTVTNTTTITYNRQYSDTDATFVYTPAPDADNPATIALNTP